MGSKINELLESDPANTEAWERTLLRQPPSGTRRGTDTSQDARELRGRIQWPLPSLGSFLLTSPNCGFCPKYLQDWARNATTGSPFSMGQQNPPQLHPLPPGGILEAGCGMRMLLARGPLAGVLSPSAPQVFGAGDGELGPGANPQGDSRLRAPWSGCCSAASQRHS